MGLLEKFKTTFSEREEHLLGTSVPEPVSSPKRPNSTWHALINDTWFWERVAMTFSISCFVAILAILISYNEKPMPTFPKGLTMNTIISILSTGSKSALLCMVAASIGQLKWLWFRGDTKRRLYDLQSFDEASRGPWGSLAVIVRCTRRGGSLMMLLGAIITILSLAFDPFMQQVLRFPVRQFDDTSVSASIQRAVLPFYPQVTSAPNSLIQPINAGEWTEGGFGLDPICPSGSCTWPAFKSAGWCTKCENVTTTAKLVGCDISSINVNKPEDQTIPCEVEFPGGYSVNKSIRVIGSETFRSRNFTLRYADKEITAPYSHASPVLNRTILGVQNPLIFLTYTQMAHLPKEVPRSEQKMEMEYALSCVLSPCVQSYNVSVINGINNIQASPPDFGDLFPLENDNLPFYLDPKWAEVHKSKLRTCWKPGPGPGPVDVEITTENWPPDAALLDDNATFAGCPIPINMELWLSGITGISYGYLYDKQTWEMFYYSYSMVALNRINGSNFIDIMENIAASLSQNARKMTNMTVQGVASVPQVYVSVDWAFFTLPALLLVSGITFVLLTMSANRKPQLGLWRSSILPVLFHGPPEWIRHEEYTTVSSMDKVAQETTVSLQPSEGRLQLQT